MKGTGKRRTDKYVSGTDIYPHMPILRPHAARSCAWEPKGNRCERHGSGTLADWSDFGFLGAKFTKMENSLPWTPMNRRAKLDAASGGEIRNRTNKTNKHKKR